LMGTWGYPVTKEELRRLGKDYLDRAGKNISVFKDNMPGRIWLQAFLTIHGTDITLRKANMLKRSRGQISRPEVQ